MLAKVCFNKFVVEFCRWSGIHSNSFQQWLVLHTLLFQWEAFNKNLLGISDGRYGLGAKVSTTSLFQRIKYVGRKTTLYCPSNIDERFCLEGVESMSCPVSLTGSWRRNRDLRVVPATCKGFLEMFTQIWSLSGLAVIHKLACSHHSERQTFPFIPGV